MTNEKMSWVGGIGTGIFKANPMPASLSIDKDTLTLELSGLWGTRYSFLPQQVISIEKYGSIPLINWGIRIRHNNATYPDKIIFWCLNNPSDIIQHIRNVGFIPAGRQPAIPVKKTNPVRWYSIVALILIWNFLFFFDKGLPPKWTTRSGWYSFIAVFLYLLGSLAIRRFQWLQILILKPNRSIDEITPWLTLISIILAFISMVLLLFLLATSL